MWQSQRNDLFAKDGIELTIGRVKAWAYVGLRRKSWCSDTWNVFGSAWGQVLCNLLESVWASVWISKVNGIPTSQFLARGCWMMKFEIPETILFVGGRITWWEEVRPFFRSNKFRSMSSIPNYFYKIGSFHLACIFFKDARLLIDFIKISSSYKQR